MHQTLPPKTKQLFTYSAPAAKRVELIGDFTNWHLSPIELQKLASGLWEAIVPLPVGEYCYRFLVDGEWHNDPISTHQVPNARGGFYSVRRVV